jgi:hypothetical protein
MPGGLGYSLRVAEPSPLGHHQSSAVEIQARLEAERSIPVFLVVREPGCGQRIVPLVAIRGPLTIGRAATCDVCVASDTSASRLHAELAPAGEEWLLVDDGLSRNGSFVNNERVVARRRLVDGDVVLIGATRLLFRRPGLRRGETTFAHDDTIVRPELTPAQRRVLVALCRPLAAGRLGASPATNPEIADELFLSVAAVKTHMRALFVALAVEEELAQNQKRRRVVERALGVGLVTERDLALPTAR